jgi:hypothetical protein
VLMILSFLTVLVKILIFSTVIPKIKKKDNTKHEKKTQ